MRISDWSSDVCSSDLETVEAATSIVIRQQDGDYPRCDRGVRRILRTIVTGQIVIIDLHPDFAFTVEDRGEVMLGTVGREFAVAKCFEQLGLDECHKIGRASCRERVCQYV